MKITLNGNYKDLQGTCTLADLLVQLTLTPGTVVVELNTLIIPPNTYESVFVSDGDQVEIIRFVGGG